MENSIDEKKLRPAIAHYNTKASQIFEIIGDDPFYSAIKKLLVNEKHPVEINKALLELKESMYLKDFPEKSERTKNIDKIREFFEWCYYNESFYR